MTELLEGIVRRSVAWWPIALKGMVARALVSDANVAGQLGRKLISDIAPHVNINGLRTSGDYGDVISSPHDLKVFAKYAAKGKWAERVVEMFGSFFDVHGGGTYVDVGANIGLTTIPVARRGDVSCYSIEPDPTNFRNLSANVRLNSESKNVRLFQTAVFDRDANLDFELCDGNLGDHRIRTAVMQRGVWGEEKRQVVRVRATTLDALVPDVGGALGVKIDTQGAEPFVFAGGSRTLARAQLVHFEWWPYSIHRLNGDPCAVTDVLQAHFKRGVIVDGESAADGREIAVSDLCSELLSRFEARRSDPTVYFDVAVTR